VANYFFVNAPALRAHHAFALQHGLSGAVAGDAIQDETYLAPEQVAQLQAALARVQARNQSLRLRVGYNWEIDLERYYSGTAPSRKVRCDLPYNRLDVHTDGSLAVCVSGKTIGNLRRESLREIWTGRVLAGYRRMYENNRPMPMCFRCCGMSNSIRFDASSVPEKTIHDGLRYAHR
jgi:hypothetical protein